VVLNILARQREATRRADSDPSGPDAGDRAGGRLRPLRPAATCATGRGRVPPGSFVWSGMRLWSCPAS
jgi:hypothetical protein